MDGWDWLLQGLRRQLQRTRSPSPHRNDRSLQFYDLIQRTWTLVGTRFWSMLHGTITVSSTLPLYHPRKQVKQVHQGTKHLRVSSCLPRQGRVLATTIDATQSRRFAWGRLRGQYTRASRVVVPRAVASATSRGSVLRRGPVMLWAGYKMRPRFCCDYQYLLMTSNYVCAAPAKIECYKH
jgi:hypothetical protein